MIRPKQMANQANANMRTFSCQWNKHVADKNSFAVGVVPGNNAPATYELFRTYHTTSADALPGPDPDRCRMPEIFAAAGAAKFFLGPRRIGKVTSFDENFPQSHPISELALEEATRLYGQHVDISVLLNIGPG